MKGYRIVGPVCAAILGGGMAAAARGGVTFAQIDDFQSGTAGWQQGVVSPQQPTVVATGGPAGPGDPYLQNVSSGSFGAGSKQVMFNTGQWTGNYVSAGVTRMTAELANFGSTPLNMRVWIGGGSLGGQYGSTNAISLPADGQWHAATFDLSASGMTSVGAPDTLIDVLSDVTQLRILSAAFGPNEHGDTVASTLGLADLRATTIPGDANHDNAVNFSDLLTLAQHYGQSSARWEDGDFNFDGSVSFNDLLALAQNYGASVSLGGQAAAAQVAGAPEPASLLAGACALLMLRRRSAFSR